MTSSIFVPIAKLTLAFCLVTLSCCSVAMSGDWPQWRGPRGDGVSEEKEVPLHWSETQNVAWKTPLPEWGTSTPAIWRNALFVTSHDESAQTLLLLKLDKQTGKIEWTRQVGRGQAVRKAPQGQGGVSRSRQKFHELHNMASPSPVTDGDLVYCHFGNGDLAAYDFAGNLRWMRNLQKDHGEYTIWWGHANSPVIVDDLLISVCMQDSLTDLGMPAAPSYLVAHDKRTGEEKWKSMRMTNARAEECDSYITPILNRVGDQQEIIVVGGDQMDAYDPKSGTRIWFLAGLAKSRIITGPTIGNGKVYATRGMRGPLLAVSTGGNGELTTSQISWQYEKGTPDSCSPVLWGKLLFIVSDNGIAQCLDAIDGRPYWQERLPGDYKASPIAVDGRIYFLNQHGQCTVAGASPKFEKLAENKIDDETTASLAVSDGHVFVRGKHAVYAIGSRRAAK